MKRVEGIRIKKDDGKNRIKYCPICSSEKKLLNESCYICESCGHTEYVILEESQIKEYSAYKRLNHFKEWGGWINYRINYQNVVFQLFLISPHAP